MIWARKRCWHKQHIWLATWRRRPTQPPDLRCEKCGHKRVSESPLRRLHPCWGRDHPVQPRLSSQTNMHHVSLFHLNPFCFSLVSPSLFFSIFPFLQNMSPFHSITSLSFSLKYDLWWCSIWLVGECVVRMNSFQARMNSFQTRMNLF